MLLIFDYHYHATYVYPRGTESPIYHRWTVIIHAASRLSKKLTTHPFSSIIMFHRRPFKTTQYNINIMHILLCYRSFWHWTITIMSTMLLTLIPHGGCNVVYPRWAALLIRAASSIFTNWIKTPCHRQITPLQVADALLWQLVHCLRRWQTQYFKMVVGIIWGEEGRKWERAGGLVGWWYSFLNGNLYAIS